MRSGCPSSLQAYRFPLPLSFSVFCSSMFLSECINLTTNGPQWQFRFVSPPKNLSAHLTGPRDFSILESKTQDKGQRDRLSYTWHTLKFVLSITFTGK